MTITWHHFYIISPSLDNILTSSWQYHDNILASSCSWHYFKHYLDIILTQSYHKLDISLTYLLFLTAVKGSLNILIHWQQRTFKSTDSWSISHYIFFTWICFRFIEFFDRHIHPILPSSSSHHINHTIMHVLWLNMNYCLQYHDYCQKKVNRANLNVIFNQNLVVKTTTMVNWKTGQKIGIW